MNGKQAKRLRRTAEAMTVGSPAITYWLLLTTSKSASNVVTRDTK